MKRHRHVCFTAMPPYVDHGLEAVTSTTARHSVIEKAGWNKMPYGKYCCRKQKSTKKAALLRHLSLFNAPYGRQFTRHATAIRPEHGAAIFTKSHAVAFIFTPPATPKRPCLFARPISSSLYDIQDYFTPKIRHATPMFVDYEVSQAARHAVTTARRRRMHIARKREARVSSRADADVTGIGLTREADALMIPGRHNRRASARLMPTSLRQPPAAESRAHIPVAASYRRRDSDVRQRRKVDRGGRMLAMTCLMDEGAPPPATSSPHSAVGLRRVPSSRIRKELPLFTAFYHRRVHGAVSSHAIEVPIASVY